MAARGHLGAQHPAEQHPCGGPEKSNTNNTLVMEEKDYIEMLVRRLMALMMVALIILMLLLTFSCGSKKKLIQKSQFTTDIATVERVSEVVEKDVKTEVSESETSKENTKEESDNFQGEVADPSLPATITEEEKDGKKIKTYTNFKNVNTGKSISESETNKTSESNLTET